MSNVEPKKNNEQKRLIIIAAILLIISAVIFAVANNWNIMGLRTAKNNGIGADTNIRVNVNKQATPKIVGGYNYFVALTAEGKVYGWGENTKGQLATGDIVNQIGPVYMGIDNAIDTAAGSYFTLVLKDDGTVWAVGINTNGE